MITESAPSKNMTDTQLVALFKVGNNYAGEILLERHIKLIEKAMREYLHKGYEEYDDMIVEAKLSFIRAIEDFNLDASILFTSFAYSYVRNSAFAQQRKTFAKCRKNDYEKLSFDYEYRSSKDDEPSSLYDTIADNTNNPETILMETDLEMEAHKELLRNIMVGASVLDREVYYYKYICNLDKSIICKKLFLDDIGFRRSLARIRARILQHEDVRGVKKCRVCGEPLRKKGTSLTCSSECAKVGKRKASIEGTAICLYCGKEFPIRPLSSNSSNKYCSNKCRLAAQTKNKPTN